jgi:hypothetical protein
MAKPQTEGKARRNFGRSFFRLAVIRKAEIAMFAHQLETKEESRKAKNSHDPGIESEV